MCTALSVKTKKGHTLLGRTMDFSYPLAPQLYAFPKGYEWITMSDRRKIKTRYDFWGMGQDIDPISFADGVNEMGFAAAALYFPGFAKYDTYGTGNQAVFSIGAVELVKLLLSLCTCVEQAVKLLNQISIVGIADSVTGSVAPLHWILSDKTGTCVVAEKTENGLQVMNNSIGVLSNSPGFEWHSTNLRNYMMLEPVQKEETTWSTVHLTPFGQGAGAMGLPGDYTPPSRFVRAAYLKSHTQIPPDIDGAVNACFHIMESVSIPKGVVMTARGTSDYTQYTAFMELSSGAYFYKTYDNAQIIRVMPPFGQRNHQQVITMGTLDQTADAKRDIH